MIERFRVRLELNLSQRIKVKKEKKQIEKHLTSNLLSKRVPVSNETLTLHGISSVVWHMTVQFRTVR